MPLVTNSSFTNLFRNLIKTEKSIINSHLFEDSWLVLGFDQVTRIPRRIRKQPVSDMMPREIPDPGDGYQKLPSRLLWPNRRLLKNREFKSTTLYLNYGLLLPLIVVFLANFSLVRLQSCQLEGNPIDHLQMTVQ